MPREECHLAVRGPKSTDTCIDDVGFHKFTSRENITVTDPKPWQQPLRLVESSAMTLTLKKRSALPK